MKEGRCSWKECENAATQPWKDKQGNTWTILCIEHNQKLDEEIASSDPKRILRAWVLAQGGAKEAAQRTMTPAVMRVTTTLISFLQKARKG